MSSKAKPQVKKVVLAYSGGLDTSVAVAWLREQYDAEVVTLTVDLGGGSLREGVERRAVHRVAARRVAAVEQPERSGNTPDTGIVIRWPSTDPASLETSSRERSSV